MYIPLTLVLKIPAPTVIEAMLIVAEDLLSGKHLQLVCCAEKVERGFRIYISTIV